ncbi:MAG TPA: LysR substrate-binding domain-containing protein, partial [Opitutaceae bacterium]|nr:LysR substrate-binding domain-containing protein [Opitutaceae bacterium]
EVARQLHFRKAAETLAIAQPALSRAVAQLEQALDADLLNRTRRGVEITAAGQLLLTRLEPILRELAAIPTDLKALAAGELGHLRVAFTGLAMSTVLPPILREFHRRHPRIRLELSESPTAAQLAALRTGELACGFFHPDTATPGIRTRVLLRERNGVLLPATHPLAARTTLTLRDLADTPFVLFPRTHNAGFYKRILDAFGSAGVTPRIAEEIWPRANGIGLVRAGLGATFMTPSEAQHLPPDITFRPLNGPAPESRLVLGWRQLTAPEPALAAFLAVVSTARP